VLDVQRGDNSSRRRKPKEHFRAFRPSRHFLN
jgi:hypothetical protein